MNADCLQIVLEMVSYYKDLLTCRMVSRGWRDGVRAAIIFRNGKSVHRLVYNDCPFSKRDIPDSQQALFRLAYALLRPTITELDLGAFPTFFPVPSEIQRFTSLAWTGTQLSAEQSAAICQSTMLVSLRIPSLTTAVESLESPLREIEVGQSVDNPDANIPFLESLTSLSIEDPSFMQLDRFIFSNKSAEKLRSVNLCFRNLDTDPSTATRLTTTLRNVPLRDFRLENAGGLFVPGPVCAASLVVLHLTDLGLESFDNFELMPSLTILRIDKNYGVSLDRLPLVAPNLVELGAIACGLTTNALATIADGCLQLKDLSAGQEPECRVERLPLSLTNLRAEIAAPFRQPAIDAIGACRSLSCLTLTSSWSWGSKPRVNLLPIFSLPHLTTLGLSKFPFDERDLLHLAAMPCAKILRRLSLEGTGVSLVSDQPLNGMSVSSFWQTLHCFKRLISLKLDVSKMTQELIDAVHTLSWVEDLEILIFLPCPLGVSQTLNVGPERRARLRKWS